jgi:hypothetical protein
MKNVNYKILVILLIFGSICYSQEFHGNAVQQTKTTNDMKLESTHFSPEQQKKKKERMKGMFEKVYELSFSTSESIYRWKRN